METTIVSFLLELLLSQQFSGSIFPGLLGLFAFHFFFPFWHLEPCGRKWLRRSSSCVSLDWSSRVQLIEVSCVNTTCGSELPKEFWQLAFADFQMRMSTKIRDYQRETRDASSYSAGILRNRSFLLHFIVLMASVMDNLFHPLMVLLNGKSS